jgi:hypothetical protein
MQPRLKISKKWTAFPKEYSEQIKAVFEENFEADLDDETISIEGRIYASEVMLRVGLKQPGRLRQSNFEVSMDYSPKNKDVLERIHNAVDAVAAMMADYFENEDKADLPRIWQEFPFQGKTVFLQYSTENSELEKQADALLGINAGDLVVGDDEEDEDALARAEADARLNKHEDDTTEGEEWTGDEDKDEDGETDVEPDVEDETGGPKMFSNKFPKTKFRKH